MDLLKHLNYKFSISQLSADVKLPTSENEIVMYHGEKDNTKMQEIYKKYSEDKISKQDVVLSYDIPTDIIKITSISSRSCIVDIVIRDIDTKLVIFNIHDARIDYGMSNWCKAYLLFNLTDIPGFRGFEVVFLDKVTKNILYRDVLLVNDKTRTSKFEFYSSEQFTEGCYLQYWETFCLNMYDKLDIKYGDVVIDGGASYGIFTKYALNRGASKVISIEPSKSYQFIKKTYEFEPHVSALNCALWKEDTHLTFYSPGDKYTLTTFKDCENSEKFTVEGLTLNTLLLRNNLECVDVLKLDIEEAEYALIDVCEDGFLSKRFKKIYIEYHKNDGIKLKKLMQRMVSENFDVHAYAICSNTLSEDLMSEVGYLVAINKENVSMYEKPAVEFNDFTDTRKIGILFFTQNKFSLDVICKIYEVYTNTPYYITKLHIDPGVQYYFMRNMNFRNKLFEITDTSGNILLKIPVFNEDGINVEKYDEFGLLKNYAVGTASDILVGFSEIFIDHTYDAAEIKIERGDVVIDVGANAGMFLYYAAIQGAGKIVAFEPNANMHAAILENYSELTNLVAVNAAVADYNGTIDMYISNSASCVSSINKTWSEHWTNDVVPVKTKCIELSDYIMHNNLSVVNFLKVDCEGAEYKIFRALSDEALRRIQKIAAEYHDIPDGETWNVHMIVDKLTKAGFKHSFKPGSDDKFGTFYAWK